jgi:hypothetical protein
MTICNYCINCPEEYLYKGVVFPRPTGEGSVFLDPLDGAPHPSSEIERYRTTCKVGHPTRIRLRVVRQGVQAYLTPVTKVHCVGFRDEFSKVELYSTRFERILSDVDD